jgi:hypothetical protein
MPAPGREADDPSLWAAAVAHSPGSAGFQTVARWLVCTATAPRLVPTSTTLDLRDVEWTFEPLKSFELDAPYAGHERGRFGRLTLLDEVPDEKARALR